MSLSKKPFNIIANVQGTVSRKVFGKDRLMRDVPANTIATEYDPVTGEFLGLVIEEFNSNFVPDPFDFSQWNGNGNYTFTTVPSGAPDGGEYQRITKNGSSILSFKPPATNSNLQLSFFVRDLQNSNSNILFNVYNSTNGAHVRQGFFTLNSAGEYSTSGPDVNVTELDSGWFWVRATVQPSQGTGYTAGDDLLIYANSGGEIGCSYDLWGYQTCWGDWQTVLRTEPGSGRDVITISDTNWFNQNEGTFYYEGTCAVNPNTADWLFELASSDRTCRIIVRDAATQNSVQAIVDSGSTQQSLNAGLVLPNIQGQNFKLAFSYINGGAFRAAINGIEIGETTVASFEQSFSILRLGADSLGNYTNTKRIKDFKFIPEASSMAELVEVTRVV